MGRGHHPRVRVDLTRNLVMLHLCEGKEEIIDPDYIVDLIGNLYRAQEIVGGGQPMGEADDTAPHGWTRLDISARELLVGDALFDPPHNWLGLVTSLSFQGDEVSVGYNSDPEGRTNLSRYTKVYGARQPLKVHRKPLPSYPL